MADRVTPLRRHYARRDVKYRELYLSFVNFSFWSDEGDVTGNVLAVLLGLADEHRGRSVMRALNNARVDEPYRVRVVEARGWGTFQIDMSVARSMS